MAGNIGEVVYDSIYKLGLSEEEILRRRRLAIDRVNQIANEQGLDGEIINFGLLRKYTEESFKMVEVHMLASLISEKRKPEIYDGSNPLMIPLPKGTPIKTVTLKDQAEAKQLFEELYSKLGAR